MRPNIVFLESLSPKDKEHLQSVSGDVSSVPLETAEKYSRFLSAFDLCPQQLLRRSRDRSPFVDQSQSFSWFLKESRAKSAAYIKDLLFLGYELGLKTIMYYCRIQKQTSLGVLECLPYSQNSDDVIETRDNKYGGRVSNHTEAERACLGDSFNCYSCQ